jgi:hypothetical protein
MNAKDVRDAVKVAKAKKVKDKDDYDKLPESSKQTIRNAQIAAATAIIDLNITEAATAGREQYTIPKSDSLLSSMDDTAIAQLVAIYTVTQGSDKITCTDVGGVLAIDWR